MMARVLNQSTVGKKMAAVHFTTIPCEPNKRMRHKESQFFTIFVPTLSTLCIVGLKIYNPSVPFYERCLSFRALRTVGKCTSRHLFSYAGLRRVVMQNQLLSTLNENRSKRLNKIVPNCKWSTRSLNL